MTDTPDRIALRWKPGAAVTQGPLFDHPDYTRWVREDVVAKAHEAQRQQMHADLLSQREAIKRAIWHIDRGELREAREVLDEELQRRDRTRPQRKGQAA